MKKLALSVLISIFCITARGQLSDRYGLRIGGGYSSIHLVYNNGLPLELSGWKQNKAGLSIYLYTDNDLYPFLSIRSEIGYIQKGFSDDIVFVTTNPEQINTDNKTVTLHDLSTDIEFRIKPFDWKLRPYLTVGWRLDYMFAYKDYVIDLAGQKLSLFKSLIDEFNKITVSGLLGMGFEFRELVCLDFEYNPGISRIIKRSGLSGRDRYFGFSAGINVSSFIKKK